MSKYDPTGTSCSGSTGDIAAAGCKVDLLYVTTSAGTFQLNSIKQLDQVKGLSVDQKKEITSNVSRIEAAMTKEFRASLELQAAGKGGDTVTVEGNSRLGIPSTTITVDRMVSHMKSGTDRYLNRPGPEFVTPDGRTRNAHATTMLGGMGGVTDWWGKTLSRDLGATFIHERMHFDRVGDSWSRFAYQHQAPFSKAVSDYRELGE
jgi:hypothetical protein